MTSMEQAMLEAGIEKPVKVEKTFTQEQWETTQDLAREWGVNL